MGLVVRKKRVFNDTDTVIDNISALDLVSFDLYYTESDAPAEQASSQSNKNEVPEPDDPNKVEPIVNQGSSNSQSEGDSSNDDNSSSDDSGASGGQDDLNNQSGDSAQNNQNSGTDDTSNDTSDDTSNGNDSEVNPDDSDNKNTASQGNSPNDSNLKDSDSSSNSNNLDNDSNPFGKTSMTDSINNLKNNKSNSSKEYEKENIDEGVQEQNNKDNGIEESNKLTSDKRERESLEDLLKDTNKDTEKEIQNQENENKRSTIYDKSKDERVSNSEAANSMGLKNIIRVKDNTAVKMWEKTLHSILKRALGTSVSFNPNLINKRVPDAPPGRESSQKSMRQVYILLDCSASMGADKFKKAILSINDFIKQSRKDLSKVEFIVIPWGDSYLNVKDYLTRLNINNFKRILSIDSMGWSTFIVPALNYIKRRANRADLIMILTDAQIFDYTEASTGAYKSFFTNNKQRIVWIVTPDYSKQYLLAMDKTALKDNRVIRLTNK